MAKTKISEYDVNPANNTDIEGINIAEGMAPGLVNNAVRELMAQLKEFQTGVSGDNFTVGGNLAITGTTTLTGVATLGGRLVDALPSGTKMLFQQTTAPIGWVKDTTHDNKALRVVTGTAGTGGSVSFTTAFGSQNVGATTLDSTQIPSHTHTFSGSGSTGDAGAHSHTANYTDSYPNSMTANNGSTTGFVTIPPAGASGRLRTGGGDGGPTDMSITNTEAGKSLTTSTIGNHNHTVSVSGTTSALGGGTSHTHTLDLAVQYVDVIVCTKS
jgi:hypothetical protein